MDFKLIESQENSRVKKARQLTLKKYRQESGRFAVENLKIIKDGLVAGFRFESVFLTQEFKDKYPEEVKFLKKQAGDAEFFLIPRKINKHISQLDSPSGVLAIYKILENKLEEESPVIYLNALNNPGNLGAVLRICLAFNFKNVVLDKNCADLYNGKTVNAAKDSVFKLNIYKDSPGDWLDHNKLPLYVSLPGRGENLEKIKPEKNFCLVLGSESRGVDEKIIKKAKKKINIKISGDIESLGVVSASAIILYKLSL